MKYGSCIMDHKSNLFWNSCIFWNGCDRKDTNLVIVPLQVFSVGTRDFRRESAVVPQANFHPGIHVACVGTRCKLVRQSQMVQSTTDSSDMVITQVLTPAQFTPGKVCIHFPLNGMLVHRRATHTAGRRETLWRFSHTTQDLSSASEDSHIKGTGGGGGGGGGCSSTILKRAPKRCQYPALRA